MKFDLVIDAHIIQQAQEIKKNSFANRFVWLIASTHENEEDIFLEIYPQLKQQIPELLLLIVPRHPERFNAVKQLVEKMQLTVCMRSTGLQCLAETDVYIADTMGELKLLYGVADVCFVGGSMVPVGGHNILEPAAMGVPILFGPYMVNFKEISNNVLALDAAIQCTSKDQIITTFVQLYNVPDYRKNVAFKAKDFVIQNQGATKKTAKIIQRILDK